MSEAYAWMNPRGCGYRRSCSPWRLHDEAPGSLPESARCLHTHRWETQTPPDRLRRSFCCFGFRHNQSRRCVGRFRLCFLSCRRFRCFQRFCRFCWIRCFGGNRFRRIRGLSCCGFAAANVCCRHCLRGKSQNQNDGQQERKQPFADWFQMQFHPSWEQNKPPLFGAEALWQYSVVGIIHSSPFRP